tara:strand:- start:786 stop:962 length:177 start_codon:yes stop_codon:yes gene_type:complete
VNQKQDDPCDLLKKIGHHSLSIIQTAKDKEGFKNYYWEQAVIINKLSRKLYEILKKQG